MIAEATMDPPTVPEEYQSAIHALATLGERAKWLENSLDKAHATLREQDGAIAALRHERDALAPSIERLTQLTCEQAEQIESLLSEADTLRRKLASATELQANLLARLGNDEATLEPPFNEAALETPLIVAARAAATHHFGDEHAKATYLRGHGWRQTPIGWTHDGRKLVDVLMAHALRQQIEEDVRPFKWMANGTGMKA